MKKVVSIFLCLLLLFSTASVALATGPVEEMPTIYVTGAQTNELYAADGHQIYPMQDDVEPIDVVKEVMKPCLEALVLGLATGDYTKYGEELYNAIIPFYGPLALDKNGEVSDGSYSRNTIYNCNIPKKKSGFGVWDYRFWYDWRISPIVAAEELKIYIDMVKEATGKSKVNLAGRCYGANVIASYLSKYEDHAVESVDDVTYLSSSVLGIDFMSALFSGDIKLNDVAIENFLNYYLNTKNIIEDETTNIFLLATVEMLRQIKLLGITGDALEELISDLKADVIPLILKDTFGTMPSYWSMVTPEKYEKARDFVYKDCKDEYAKLIEKTDDYYYNVQSTVKEDMLSLKAKGIDFKLFVKYGFPDYPLYENAACQGDGTTAAVRQGFGGEYADYGKVFSEKYIKSLENTKYLSADHKINAESCLFPDETWFVKGIHHDIFPNSLVQQAMRTMNEELDVNDGVIPQFQTYVNGNYSETTGLDEDGTKPADNIFATMLRFFTAFFNFITKLLNGEISFG
ncbi:MAG: hypothetical protein ACI4GC_04725 [Acutalibacteraceae bacterium]